MNVLIIDDEQDFLDFMESNLLQGFPGSRIIRASDGREALQRCQEHVFDLICADIQMPGLNGLEFSRLLRACRGPNDAAPIIFISGYAESFREEAGQLSNTFFVEKPFRISNFMSIVSLASGNPQA